MCEDGRMKTMLGGELNRFDGFRLLNFSRRLFEGGGAKFSSLQPKTSQQNSIFTSPNQLLIFSSLCGIFRLHGVNLSCAGTLPSSPRHLNNDP